MKTVANCLRQQRRRLGYTQQQMADYLEIHRTTYTKYESDAADPPLATLCRIADLLGCTTDLLLVRK